MTFAPRIDHNSAAVGIFRFDVADGDGVWLGVISVARNQAGFISAVDVALTADQLVRIAHFMREKTDAK